MPREPIPLIRKGGFLEAEKLYVLSYEGIVTEKIYFQNLRNSQYFNNSGFIEIISLKRPKNKGSEPFSVKKLLKEVNAEYGFKDSDEFWLIIDRDNWETLHKLSFDELVIECQKERNFFLAMSNPCFEIWLILHLKDLSEFSDEERSLIYQNRKVGNKNYIDLVVADLQGADRGYNKIPKASIYLPRTKLAVERARSIDSISESYPKSLGSHVYKLVEKLTIQNIQ